MKQEKCQSHDIDFDVSIEDDDEGEQFRLIVHCRWRQSNGRLHNRHFRLVIMRSKSDAE